MITPRSELIVRHQPIPTSTFRPIGRSIASRARLTLDSPTSRLEADRLDLTSRSVATPIAVAFS